MTEDEAKGKWCPQVRFADPRDGEKPSVEPTSWNRFDEEWDYTGLLCIASDCMMWRWNAYGAVDVRGKSIAVPITEQGGYCGLAGKP